MRGIKGIKRFLFYEATRPLRFLQLCCIFIVMHFKKRGTDRKANLTPVGLTSVGSIQLPASMSTEKRKDSKESPGSEFI